jgi:hypothetical protein
VRAEIPPRSWTDLSIFTDSHGRIFAGYKRTGHMAWIDLRFAREQVLKLWPGSAALLTAEQCLARDRLVKHLPVSGNLLPEG